MAAAKEELLFRNRMDGHVVRSYSLRYDVCIIWVPFTSNLRNMNEHSKTLQTEHPLLTIQNVFYLVKDTVNHRRPKCFEVKCFEVKCLRA